MGMGQDSWRSFGSGFQEFSDFNEIFPRPVLRRSSYFSYRAFEFPRGEVGEQNPFPNPRRETHEIAKRPKGELALLFFSGSVSLYKDSRRINLRGSEKVPIFGKTHAHPCLQRAGMMKRFPMIPSPPSGWQSSLRWKTALADAHGDPYASIRCPLAMIRSCRTRLEAYASVAVFFGWPRMKRGDESLSLR